MTIIGNLEIYFSPRGVNKKTLATEFKKGRMEFTPAAVKAYNEGKNKKAILMVPISETAFRANGASPGTFAKWIKSIVFDQLGNSRRENYKIEAYQELRNQLSRK